MLALTSFGLKDFLYKGLYDVNDSFSFFSHRVQLPLELSDCLLHLDANHLVELLILLIGY